MWEMPVSSTHPAVVLRPRVRKLRRALMSGSLAAPVMKALILAEERARACGRPPRRGRRIHLDHHLAPDAC